MHETFLPSIRNEAAVGGQGDHDAQEMEIYQRMQAHPEQRRPTLTWHATLTAVARAYCERMAREGFTGHADPQGKGPNHRVRAAGYKLPAHYGTKDSSNNIESLLWGGDGGIQQVWDAWMGSEHHRTHLLGHTDFYRGQVNIGIGHAHVPGSRWLHYYAVLTAHAEEK